MSYSAIQPTGARALVVLVLAAAGFTVFTQASPQSPTYEVVSIKRNLTGGSQNITERPDGGLSVTNLSPDVLIGRAYPPAVPRDIVGLPGWASTERYDIRATSPLSTATSDERIAMLRAMFADRFKMVAHVEKREQPVFDLTLARRDGRLGPSIKRIETDCVQVAAERAAAAEAARVAGTPPPPRESPDFKAFPPSCTLRLINAVLRDIRGDGLGRLGDLLEGEGTMDEVARSLLFGAGRPIVNKTGLSGSYRLTLNYDMKSFSLGPASTPADSTTTDPGAPASVFSAVQEQLGLKLESSREVTDTLVIDHLERPTEN